MEDKVNKLNPGAQQADSASSPIRSLGPGLGERSVTTGGCEQPEPSVHFSVLKLLDEAAKEHENNAIYEENSALASDTRAAVARTRARRSRQSADECRSAVRMLRGE